MLPPNPCCHQIAAVSKSLPPPEAICSDLEAEVGTAAAAICRQQFGFRRDVAAAGIGMQQDGVVRDLEAAGIWRRRALSPGEPNLYVTQIQEKSNS